MAFSERHRARWGGNVAIAGALLTFCAGTYWYTVRKVRTDEMDLAIERRGGGLSLIHISEPTRPY